MSNCVNTDMGATNPKVINTTGKASHSVCVCMRTGESQGHRGRLAICQRSQHVTPSTLKGTDEDSETHCFKCQSTQDFQELPHSPEVEESCMRGQRRRQRREEGENT